MAQAARGPVASLPAGDEPQGEVSHNWNPVCGCVSADNRKTQAVFRCIECGHEGHADHIGAINILARGHRAAACGEHVRRGKAARPTRAASAKQEPTEVTQAGFTPT